MLKRLALLLALLLATPAFAQDMSWAYPPVIPPPPTDPSVQLSVPGSTAHFTFGDIDDYFKAMDWFPNEHPSMPNVPVATGRPPELRACAVCHLPDGTGHPESSNLAGQSVDYITRQMHAFAHGERANARSRLMVATAKAANDNEVAAAASYFAALPLANSSRVEEATEVPRTVVGSGAMRFIDPAGGFEPLDQRIIVVPMNGPDAAARDMHVGFISYVPSGSIARGAALAIGTQKDDPLACATCHGAGLRGSDLAPTLIGQHPIYVFRQLNDMKTGKRIGGNTALMAPIVAALDTDSMIALAAYIGSLKP
jgi:cytochrome c553